MKTSIKQELASHILDKINDGVIDWNNANNSKENAKKIYKAIDTLKTEGSQGLKLAIDGESVNIYREESGIDEPIHICYWHIEEVEEDANVAFAIIKAIELYYTDQEKLLRTLGLESYIM